MGCRHIHFNSHHLCAHDASLKCCTIGTEGHLKVHVVGHSFSKLCINFQNLRDLMH